VKSACETLDGNKVKLSVTIDESDFDRDIDAAFKKIAREVRLPGFRQGKAPRKVLEARIGLPAAREQALRDAIPKYLGLAVKEQGVDLIATPEVEITSGEDDGPVVFDATCEIRPEIEVPGYGGLRVELPSLVVTDAEVDDAVEAERKKHGVLTDVDRPAASGDYVVIDLEGTRDGEPVIGLNTTEWSYEIGRGWVSPIFDSELEGKSAGDVFTFSDTPNGTEEEADFHVTVTKVQELVLPEVTDEWVSENLGEFDTIAEWRQSISDRLGTGKLGQARSVVIDRLTGALAELVEIEPPEPMVNGDLQARVQNTVQQFQAQGINLDQWLQVTGQDPASFVEGLRGQSEKAVKVDLALRAVATAEGIVADDDDLDAEFERIAVQVNEKVARVRKVYEQNDAVDDLAANIRKSKALDWLLDHAEMVDTEGNPIERDLLLGRGEHAPDHAPDHDHDHDHAGHDHDHDH
jgi:trigger factor